MNTNVQTRLDLFINNVSAAKKGFVWKNTMIRRLAALLYMAENRSIDIDAIRGCNTRIKASTGVFSVFRGDSALSIATLLSMSANADRLLNDTLTVYELMKKSKFGSSDFLVVAACLVARQADPGRFAEVANRARAFYEGMKKAHWFITGQDDTIYSAMLGLSNLAVDAGVDRIERLYEELKPDFCSRNSVQALAQVLVLGGESTDPTSRVRALADAFRAEGLKLDKEYTLPALGVLALLPLDKEATVRSVIETFGYLRMQKGFSAWAVNKQELLLLSAALVAFISADDMEKDIVTSALSTSIASMVIAQQTAVMVAAVTAASAAASSAASN